MRGRQRVSGQGGPMRLERHLRERGGRVQLPVQAGLRRQRVLLRSRGRRRPRRYRCCRSDRRG